MDILKMVFTVLEALLALNLLIFVHELGHFLAARWRGMKIDRFAIWFGKPVWKKKIGGVEYALGWIPAGGYVALPQMATMELIEGRTEKLQHAGRAEAPQEVKETSKEELRELPPVSPLDKIIVALAGPLFSFALAVCFAFIVWGVGRPEQEAKDDSTVIGWVEPTGPAAKAGLRPGDKILEIDGHAVAQFAPTTPDSVTWRVVTSEGTNIAVKYVRDGKVDIAYPVPVKPPTKWYERKSLRKIMLSPARPTFVAEVLSNSPAAAVGLRADDEIIALDGQPILAPEAIDYAQRMQTNEIRPVTLTVKRGNQQLDFKLAAEIPIKPAGADPVFGFELWFGSTNEVLAHPKPLDQIRSAGGQIFATLNAVFSRKSDVGIQQLGGAVMIIRAYKNFFGSDNGWRRVLWFSVILNVNLALLNLLPLPVLDGGHVLLSLIEAVRRRAASPKVLSYIQNGFAVLLITFMVWIAFYDIGDWIRSARKDRSTGIVFAPKD